MAHVEKEMSTNSSGPTFPWLEAILENYKENPISDDYFEIVGGAVESFMNSCNLEESLDVSEGSLGSYCGISFKRDQLMYHCR